MNNFELNMQIEHDENGGSEQPSCSNVGQTLALRKIVREELKPMVISTVRSLMKPMVMAIFQQEIKSLFEGLFRSVVTLVKDEIQKHLTGGSRNDLPKERSLQLKFLDEVCGPVQTGIPLIGKKDRCLKLALVDANGDVVCESSAKVEIVLLSDNVSDDEGNMTLENFERRIIRTGDKEKPHFAKSVYINLEKGICSLTNLKLGHGEKWTKLWNCRLGAKMAENLPRTVVQEAWTEPFKVIDKRIEHYKKDESPSPTSKVWRVKGIGRDGNPFKRLTDRKIESVQDFRFWLSVNPTELQEEILEAGESRWNTITSHAKDCSISDKKMYCHNSSTGPLKGVIYDALGELKGVIDESHFVPVADLSDDQTDHAKNLLRSVLEPSAFLQRYKTFFNDEASLLQKFPCRSSDSADASSKSLNGSENIPGLPTTGPDLSSQNMVLEHEICDVTRPSGSLESRDTDELHNISPCLFPYAGDTLTDPGLNHSFQTRLQSENHELFIGTVGVPSSILPDTSLFSANSFGENGAAHEDFGSSSRSATDHMVVSEARLSDTLQCSPGFSTDLEEYMEKFPSTSPFDTDLTLPENVDEDQTMGPCLSPQSIIPGHHDWSWSPNLYDNSWMILSNGDEENAADEPQVVDRRSNPPKRWKKLVCASKWFAVRRLVVSNDGHSRKKQKVG